MYDLYTFQKKKKKKKKDLTIDVKSAHYLIIRRLASDNQREIPSTHGQVGIHCLDFAKEISAYPTM